jgi:hypothetical protein
MRVCIRGIHKDKKDTYTSDFLFPRSIEDRKIALYFYFSYDIKNKKVVWSAHVLAREKMRQFSWGAKRPQAERPSLCLVVWHMNPERIPELQFTRKSRKKPTSISQCRLATSKMYPNLNQRTIKNDNQQTGTLFCGVCFVSKRNTLPAGCYSQLDSKIMNHEW